MTITLLKRTTRKEVELPYSLLEIWASKCDRDPLNYVLDQGYIVPAISYEPLIKAFVYYKPTER